MRYKIIVDNKIPFIEGRLEPLADVVYAEPLAITPELVSDADALLVRTRTKCNEALLGGSRVRLVATATIGMDHFDADWLGKAGITAVNSAGCNAPGVAQYVWSSLLRNGFDPATHTLGVIGYGHIGSIVADWGRKLGARILVCDPPRKDDGITDEDYLPMEVLLRECDAVTLHTPLSRGGKYPTYHLMAEKELAMMKPGATLVNASRGPVVDNAAWLAHLKKSPCAKAVVDVWEGEPDLNTELMNLAEISSPHIAGYSLEGKERATRMVIEAVEKEFGVELDKSGLEGEYEAPAEVDASVIVSSYDPYADTALLRSAPGELERLRDTYPLRHEPRFNQ